MVPSGDPLAGRPRSTTWSSPSTRPPWPPALLVSQPVGEPGARLDRRLRRADLVGGDDHRSRRCSWRSSPGGGASCVRPFFSTAAMVGLAAAYVGVARDAEQLELPQLPAGPVSLGRVAVARSPIACRAPGRIVLALARAVVLGRRWGSTTCGSTATAPRSPRGSTPFPSGRPCFRSLFKRSRTGEVHRQPDARLGLLHRGQGHLGAAGVRRSSAPTRSPTASFRRATSIPPALDRFAESERAPAADVCRRLKQPKGAPSARWSCASSGGLLAEAEPRFSHLLTWAMPPEARALIPPRYRRVFASGELEIYARSATRSGMPQAEPAPVRILARTHFLARAGFSAK